MNRIGIFALVGLVLAGLLSTMVFIVDQREFGVVYQFGRAQEVIKEPGLKFKWPPPFQNVVYMDKRLLSLESRDTEPVLTAEKQRMVVDWFVRWRITEPLEYIRHFGLTVGDGEVQLNRVVRDALQVEINRLTVPELISTRREGLMEDVLEQVRKTVEGWGIEVIDVRITSADYVESITEKVYTRMQAERQRAANELRATGDAEAESIRAAADKQREITVADAYREAETLRGEGDGHANRIYAEAFGQDAEFARFMRNLDAYQNSVGQEGDVLVIDPAAIEFFQTMQDGKAGRAP